MKYLYRLFILAFLFAQQSYGQFWENNFIYANAGISTGNFLGVEAGFNYIKYEKLYFGLNYANPSDEAKNKPVDYSGGLLGSDEVKDIHHSFKVSSGYVITLNPKKTIRLNLRGGIGVRWSRIATDFQQHSTGAGWFSSTTYSYDRESKYSAEITVFPAIEFPLARGYGLSLGPPLSVADGRTFVGLSLNNIFGVVRGKTSANPPPN